MGSQYYDADSAFTFWYSEDMVYDCIFYSGFSQSQALPPIDQVILKLLYHPLACGINATDCEAIIRSLYY